MKDNISPSDNTLPTFIDEEKIEEKKGKKKVRGRPFTSNQSRTEAAKNGSIGGINSGEARRRAKTMREAAKIFGETETEDPQNEFQRLTFDEIAILQQYRKAREGNTKAVEFLADLKGERVQKVEMTATISAMVQARQADPYAYLYRPFSLTYQQFFYDNRDSRHVLLQGGRRSGKTQATIRHLLRLCAASGGENKIMVVCYQHPQLLKTIEDFVQITGIEPKADKATTEGALWHFCNFDDYTKAQGSQCDYLFINEAVNMTEDIADTLVLGTRKQCFYNYNPTKSSWVSKLVAPDGHNLLCTTFKDNDYLPAEQIAEFERMKERALLPTASMHDKFVYEVFYLGNFANMVGQVFGRIERCTLDDYQQLQCTEVYGMDFGFATDGDPTVLVGVKIAGNKIYIRQIIYEQGLTSNEVLTKRMQQAGLNQYCDIRADYGGMGKGRIADLRRLNWSIQPCYKTAVLDGISQMLCYDGVVIVEGGDETAAEFEGYELTEGGKIKSNDHAIDATRYAFIVCKLSI